MKLRLIILLGYCFSSHLAQAQSITNLFDDSKVCRIDINLPADTLADIYSDIYSDRYRMAQFIFSDGIKQDTVDSIGFRLRGNTSRNAAKKSFKVSFNTFVNGQRYQGVKKINLNGSHNDPTIMREKIFYDIWKEAKMPERRTAFVTVYINGDYFGIYTNLEEIDKDWLQRVYGENDGNLYKCTYPADMVYIGGNASAYKNIPSGSSTGGRAYDLQTNEALDDYSDLVTLITNLNQTPNAAFETQIKTILNVKGVMRALALDVATGNWDDYAYNKNNYFLYHNLNTNKFEFITYDTDNCLGIDWVGVDWATRQANAWISNSPRPLMSKLLAVPAFRQIYEHDLDSITRYITEPDSIFPHLDNVQNLLRPYLASDGYYGLDYGFNLGSFDNGMTQNNVVFQAPYGIKPFLGTRQLNTISQLLSLAPIPSSFKDVKVYPNPMADILTLNRHKHLEDCKVMLYDQLGHLILENTWQNNEHSLSLSVNDLPKGVYVLVIQNPSGELAAYKLIKP